MHWSLRQNKASFHKKSTLLIGSVLFALIWNMRFFAQKLIDGFVQIVENTSDFSFSKVCN